MILLGNRHFSLLDDGLSQQPQIFAAAHGLSPPRCAQLVERTGTMRLDRVFGDEELRSDLAVTEPTRDQGQDLKFPLGDPKGLLLRPIGRERCGGLDPRRNDNLLDDHRLAHDLASARQPQSEPDAKGGEGDGDKRSVNFYGMLDDDEAVLNVLERGDENSADDAEDEGVTLHPSSIENTACDKSAGGPSEKHALARSEYPAWVPERR